MPAAAPKPHLYKCSNPDYPLLWKCAGLECSQYADSPREAYAKWEQAGGKERASAVLMQRYEAAFKVGG